MGKITYSIYGALLVALTLLVAACGGSGYGGSGYGGGGGGGGTGPVASISITPTSMSVSKGSTQTYTATAKDSGGNTVTGVTYNWASSSPGIAAVNSSGVATADADGTTMITASVTYSGGIYGMNQTITSNSATLTVTGMVSGTAAMGQAVANGTVSLVDANGQIALATTDDAGHFAVPAANLTAPFLLRLEDGMGHQLFGAAASVGTANIDPYTDLLVRQMYSATQTTPAAAFADAVHHPLPGAAQMQALDAALVASIGPALSRLGVNPMGFSVLSTPFEANHAGFDALLDETALDAGGQLATAAVKNVAAMPAMGMDSGHTL